MADAFSPAVFAVFLVLVLVLEAVLFTAFGGVSFFVVVFLVRAVDFFADVALSLSGTWKYRVLIAGRCTEILCSKPCMGFLRVRLVLSVGETDF